MYFGVSYYVSRHYLVCLSLLVCGYGSPCGAVVMLRFDPGAKILLVRYVAGPLTLMYWIAWYALEPLTKKYCAPARGCIPVWWV